MERPEAGFKLTTFPINQKKINTSPSYIYKKRLLCILKMAERFPADTAQIQEELDSLVLTRFEQLYSAEGDEYYTVWREIASKLAEQYTIGLNPRDSQRVQRYIAAHVENYARKDFPLDLGTEQARSFVRCYGKLPHQDHNLWMEYLGPISDSPDPKQAVLEELFGEKFVGIHR